MSQSRPELRASHRQRQETVRVLRGQLREGRLSDVTFVRRLVLALDARRRADLDLLVADLPARPSAYRGLRRLGQRLAALATRLVPRRSAPEVCEFALPPVPGDYVVGRSDEVDLRLDHISVSRRHALFAYVDGGWVVADLGSRNGTWLNGWRLPGPAPVAPGDVLDLGSCRFVVVDKRSRRARFRSVSAG